MNVETQLRDTGYLDLVVGKMYVITSSVASWICGYRSIRLPLPWAQIVMFSSSLLVVYIGKQPLISECELDCFMSIDKAGTVFFFFASPLSDLKCMEVKNPEDSV